MINREKCKVFLMKQANKKPQLKILNLKMPFTRGKRQKENKSPYN